MVRVEAGAGLGRPGGALDEERPRQGLQGEGADERHLLALAGQHAARDRARSRSRRAAFGSSSPSSAIEASDSRSETYSGSPGPNSAVVIGAR